MGVRVPRAKLHHETLGRSGRIPTCFALQPRLPGDDPSFHSGVIDWVFARVFTVHFTHILAGCRALPSNSCMVRISCKENREVHATSPEMHGFCRAFPSNRCRQTCTSQESLHEIKSMQGFGGSAPLFASRGSVPICQSISQSLCPITAVVSLAFRAYAAR